MSDIPKSPKAKAIEDFLEAVAPYGRSGECCATCGSRKINSEDFKDERSRREFSISLMCQGCQDEFFEGEWE